MDWQLCCDPKQHRLLSHLWQETLLLHTTTNKHRNNKKKDVKISQKKNEAEKFFINMKQQMFSPDSRAYTYLIVQGPIRENRKENLFRHVVYSRTTAPEHYSAWSEKTLGNRDFKIAQPQKSGRFEWSTLECRTIIIFLRDS